MYCTHIRNYRSLGHEDRREEDELTITYAKRCPRTNPNILRPFEEEDEICTFFRERRHVTWLPPPLSAMPAFTFSRITHVQLWPRRPGDGRRLISIAGLQRFPIFARTVLREGGTGQGDRCVRCFAHVTAALLPFSFEESRCVSLVEKTYHENKI